VERWREKERGAEEGERGKGKGRVKERRVG
jgi:hypothetical protein